MTLIGTTADGAALLLLKEPVACPECKRMAYLVVNRDGTSRCIGCSRA